MAKIVGVFVNTTKQVVAQDLETWLFADNKGFVDFLGLGDRLQVIAFDRETQTIPAMISVGEKQAEIEQITV